MTTTWANNSKNSSSFTNVSKSSTSEQTEALYDSYSESNADVFFTIPNSGTLTQVGQSFIGNGGLLTDVKFYLKKSGSTTGNITAYLYAHSGTYGTSSVATGSALATSSTVDSSTLTSTATLYTFTFDGTYTLVDGTNYVIAIEYTGGNYFGGIFINVGCDQTSSTHAGNGCFYDGAWTASSNIDLAFYIYTITSEDVYTSWTNPSKPLEGNTVATAGMGSGLLLALTYSGGEILVVGGPVTWTSVSKN